jgi:hypothetical protein
MRRSVGLLTAEGRFDFIVRGEPFAVYRCDGAGDVFTAIYVPGGGTILHNLRVLHGDINGIGFGIENGTGRIGVEETTARRGSYSVGFRQTRGWFASDGNRVLTETREIRIAPGPCEGGILDLTLDFIAPEDREVTFGRTEAAFVASQVAGVLRPTGSGQIRNSVGDYGAEALNGRSAAWVGGIGVVAGETAGFVWLDHPTNRWHPTLWAVHTDGFLSPSPFVWRSLALDPGKRMRLRYRLLVHRGYVEQGWADSRLAEFARE